VARHRVSLFRNGQPPFRGCRREPAKTLVLGVQGRVFEQRAFDRSILSEDGFAFWPTVYACLFDRSRSHRLGKETVEGSEVIAPHLAGPYVGYAFVRDAGPGGETLSSIRIKDLRDGKTYSGGRACDSPRSAGRTSSTASN
jgi:hypothetical protein